MTYKSEIAMHCMAQLTKFVVRKQMTADDAANMAFDLADAFIRRINKEREPIPTPKPSPGVLVRGSSY